ncbi:MAG: hypothetical protein O2992_04230 [Gemmatimonadetes bacterium]|jgi:signal transduction histidine kinase|nr:hypothetical protein [Gemmatimonadota bacterium]
MGRILRSYQASHLVLAVFVATVPLRWVFATSLARFVRLMPILAVAVVLLLRGAVRGNPEARVFLVGILFVVLAEVGEFLRLAGLALPHSLPYLGFTALLLSAAVALAYRFARAHAELDELRLGLAGEVTARTPELEAMTLRAPEASDGKSQLLSTMNHELTAPLKSIAGFARIVLT